MSVKFSLLCWQNQSVVPNIGHQGLTYVLHWIHTANSTDIKLWQARGKTTGSETGEASRPFGPLLPDVQENKWYAAEGAQFAPQMYKSVNQTGAGAAEPSSLSSQAKGFILLSQGVFFCPVNFISPAFSFAAKRRRCIFCCGMTGDVEE